MAKKIKYHAKGKLFLVGATDGSSWLNVDPETFKGDDESYEPVDRMSNATTFPTLGDARGAMTILQGKDTKNKVLKKLAKDAQVFTMVFALRDVIKKP